MDFDQTYIDIFLGVGKKWSDFGNPDLIFKVAGGQKMLEKCLVLLYFLNG